MMTTGMAVTSKEPPNSNFQLRWQTCLQNHFEMTHPLLQAV